MVTEARHHHYVPQAYLQGFANARTGKKRTKWFTFVSDFKKKRSYETNVRNVCGERDFMRFETQNHPPTKLEHELGQFEGKACQAIRRVVDAGKFEGEDKIQILNLMALLAVRSPEQRENVRDFHERVAKQIMNLSLATKDRWEGQMRQLQNATGKTYKKTYEDIKQFHESGRYKVTLPRERHIGLELSLFETVLDLLWKRKWTLYTCSGEHGHFITTNCPVVLSFNEPHKHAAWDSAGFGRTGTEVFFPLTKHGLLIGRWDRGGHTEVAGQPLIGVVNMHMIQHSSGQAFSHKRVMLYHDPLLRLHWDDKVVDRFTTPPTPEELKEFEATHGRVGDQSAVGR
jgi:hypothetical protein